MNHPWFSQVIAAKARRRAPTFRRACGSFYIEHNMDPYVIGIDLGTGSAKALAVNRSGLVIDTLQATYPTLCPQPDYQEQDPEVIWKAFIKCLSGVTGNLKQLPAAVCLSSAMHSVIPVGKDGMPLMNMIIWADNRSAAVARRVHQSSAAEMLYEQTGTPIHAMTPLCKIKWLGENEPALFEKTAKLISMKEYVWHKLFGIYEVDYSIASATGLLDIEALVWNANALDIAGIRPDQLSTPVNANHIRTCADTILCKELGVHSDTPFMIGASDGCLANIGSFATAPGVMALTIGTSGAVRVMSRTPTQNFQDMTFNYRLDDTSYVCGGPINNGGLVLKWYAEKLLGTSLSAPDDYTALLATLSETGPGADGLIFLPYVWGERAPIWNSDASGVFFGIRAHNRQAHFTRAVVEGITMALYDITHGMIARGLSLKQIQVSGGFVHSEHWLQILADIFQQKICLANAADASAIGAAFLAMKQLQLIEEYDDLKPKQVREFFPESGTASIYKHLYGRYTALYDRVSELMTGAT
jgi:gluconokinase